MAISSTPIHSIDVFQWPEFKALVARLGVDMSRYDFILSIGIFLDRDASAKVCLEIAAEDRSHSRQ